MSYFRSSLERISKQQGRIGAFQSRLQSAVNNLQSLSQSYSEAYSRITDADIADESAHLLSTRILQQGATEVLKQANIQPQLALTLISNI